jgi:hypothetical protein
MIFSSAGGWDLPHSSSTTLPMPWEATGDKAKPSGVGALSALLF